MGEGERRPLFNTFLLHHVKEEPEMQRRALMFVLMIVCSGSIFFTVQAQEVPTTSEGATLDVLTLEDDCIEQLDCVPLRPQHFIEYFSADWCEPCTVLDHDLEDLIDNETFVMRHHPSPQDLTYNSISNQRFNVLYRLLFLPTLIHNGEGLLTGTSQAQELGEVLSNSTSVFTGLTDVEISNDSVSWNTSVEGTVTVWRIGTVQHETENYSHRNMVLGAVHFNAADHQGNITELMTMNGTGVVVMLERDGVRNLTVRSTNPALGLDLIENEDNGILSSLNERPRGHLAILTTIFLVALMLPALKMWRDTLGTKPVHQSDEEES